MKKLLSLFMLLTAALSATDALAQQHVYINDPFTGGKPGTAWDTKNISAIGAISMDDGPWPAWFYDAKGQLFNEAQTTQVQGLQVVQSNIIPVDETGGLFLSMDLYALTLTRSKMRDFGVRIRLISGTEWDTLFSLRQNGVFPVYSNGYEATAEVAIGDRYNGKNIILQIFFYNDSIATDAFIMAFNHVFLATYGPDPKVETRLLSRPFAYGDTYEARLNGINQSMNPLTGIEYAYSVNGKAEKKQKVSFADTLEGWGTAAAFDLAIDLAEADIDTVNRIQIWPVAVDGQAYAPAAGDTLGFNLAVADESRLDQDYVPMLECFTSATCQPCRQLNPYLNPVLAELKAAGKLNVVKYQEDFPGSGDKYYIAGNGTRDTYYGVRGVPTLIFNGTEQPLTEWPANSYNGLMNELRERADAASQNKSFFTIKVNRAEVKPDSTVELDFDITSHLPNAQAERMNVFAMVVEGTTHGNKVVNSETDFHYVNMAFATPAQGKASYFSRERTVNFAYTVNMKKTHMEELSDLQVVIFVQDPTDKYIYQSAGVLMGPGEMTAVEKEELAQVSVYPNPASHTVYVAGLEKARVEIFDLGGRKVYERADAEGVMEVSLASFAKGAYVVRVSQNGAVASRKLVVK